MFITIQELLIIKRGLPTDGIKKIANQLEVNEQCVRNFFGATKNGPPFISGWHKQPGPNGGVCKIEDPTILNMAIHLIISASLKTIEYRKNIAA